MIGYVIRGEEEAKKWYNGHMNSKEASEYLGISRYMLRKLVLENKIPYTKHYRDVSYHQIILDAWMRGEFIPGRVELILDEVSIEFDHRDALIEHYKKYPELREKVKEEGEIPFSSSDLDYSFEVRQDGVLISLSSSEGTIVVQMFLRNNILNQIIDSVREMRKKT